MSNDITLGKRRIDQATNIQQEQSLRRLKYLHTSLASTTKSRASNLKPLQTTPSLIMGLDLPEKDGTNDSLDRRDKDKRCFLALKPDNVKGDIRRSRPRNSRQRHGWSPVCKGRAPLASPSTAFSSSFHSLSTKKESQLGQKTREDSTHGKVSSQGKDRLAKSAPSNGGVSTLNPEEFDCVQCFANEIERLQCSSRPEYNTNMRINRITFSARPNLRNNKTENNFRLSTKLISEKTFKIPQTLYGGWGIRRRRKVTDVPRNPRDTREELDVAAELQTLRIEPRGTEEREKSKDVDVREPSFPPPTAPPTPIRQIDIKMPEGNLVQHRLQSVA